MVFKIISQICYPYTIISIRIFQGLSSWLIHIKNIDSFWIFLNDFFLSIQNDNQT